MKYENKNETFSPGIEAVDTNDNTNAFLEEEGTYTTDLKDQADKKVQN